MQNQWSATKANLIRAKGNLHFSENGYTLLDKKRTVLIRKAMQLIDRAQELQNTVQERFQEAYTALQAANIVTGVSQMQNLSLSIPKTENFEILFHSVMGLEIPAIHYEVEENKPTYSFYMTNSAVDQAVEKFTEIKYLIYELSEVENAVYSLALEIKKTAKRANALEKIQIPRYEALTKQIEDTLEEKDREDFFRLKKIKSKKTKNV